jgi:hypothetical protein
MNALSSMSLGTSLPAIDPALEPASVRNGDSTAKKAYQEGLAFEDVLVNELSQEMSSTTGLDGSSGLGGTTDSSDSGSGLGGGAGLGGSSLGAYSSLLPQALTSSVMSAGGTGLALQIARSIDPALAAPAPGGKS